VEGGGGEGEGKRVLGTSSKRVEGAAQGRGSQVSVIVGLFLLCNTPLLTHSYADLRLEKQAEKAEEWFAKQKEKLNVMVREHVFRLPKGSI